MSHSTNLPSIGISGIRKGNPGTLHHADRKRRNWDKRSEPVGRGLTLLLGYSLLPVILAIGIMLGFGSNACASSSWSSSNIGLGDTAQVYALAVDGSGNLYAGGYFTSAGGVTVNNIAKWDGSSWSALGTGMNGTVYALAVDGSGNLYAGGNFTMAGGVTGTAYIAKWDGSSWSALGTGMSGTVYALAVDGSGNLYAGGNFTMAGGITGTAYIAKWSDNSWYALGTGMSGTVFALAVDRSGNLYAGGYFTSAGGVTVNNIAKWDPNATPSPSWSALGTGMDGTVKALAADGRGNLYAGGGFTMAGGVTGTAYIAKWNDGSWSALGTGMNSTVKALAADVRGNLYVGGYFTMAGGVTGTAYIAQWDGSLWSALGTGMNGTVYALAMDGSGNLYVGGDFTTAGGISSKHIAYWTVAITIPTNGLIAWYPFSGNADDKSGNGNNGEVFGGATLTSDRFGNADSAYSFNGSSYISVPDSTSLAGANSEAITVAAWVKLNDPDNDQKILRKDNGSTESGFTFGVTGSTLYSEIRALEGTSLTNNVLRETDGCTTFSAYQWVFLAVTWDADGSYTGYVNGAKSCEKTVVGSQLTLNNGYPLRIGGGLGYDPVIGYIDDVYIYNRALSSSEITDLYFSSNLNNRLLAYWSFDACDATDDSGNANNGSVLGDPGPECVDGASGKAYSFDGTHDYIQIPSLLTASMNGFSFASWVKVNSLSGSVGDERTAIYNSPNTGEALLEMIPDGSGTGNFAFGANVDNTFYKAQWSATAGKYVYLVGVYRRENKVELWANGELMATTEIPSGSGNLYTSGVDASAIGAYTFGSYEKWWDGKLDEVRIYSKALLESEIKQLYGLYIPRISLSTNSNDFGSVSVNGSSSIAVTISNTGNGSLNVAGITLSDITNFSIDTGTGTCGSTTPGISSGDTCTFGVRFTPLSQSALSTNVTVSSNDSSYPTVTFTLSGTGIATTTTTTTIPPTTTTTTIPPTTTTTTIPPTTTTTTTTVSTTTVVSQKPKISTSTSSSSFDSVAVGSTSSPITVTIGNGGNAVLNVSGITLSDNSNFSLDASGGCGSTTPSISPGETCTFNVNFTPQSAGSFNVAVIIASNDFSSPNTNTVSLSGTGTAPSISVSPTSKDFGNVYIGDTSQSLDVTITNNGSASLNVSQISLSDTSNFSLDPSSCSTTAPSIAPGSSCAVSAKFTPKSSGTLTSSLTVTSNDTNTPTISISLNGEGTAVPVPNMSVSPSKLDFGSVKVGTMSAKDVTISNTGTGSLSVSSIALSEGSSSAFSLDVGGGSNACGSSSPAISAGESCTASVSFSPYSVDAYKPSSVDANTFSGTLTIQSDDPDTSTTSVSITGVATSSESIKTTISVPAATEAVGSTINGYRMVGIPMVPASADVFTTLAPSFGGSYNAGVWRMMVCEQESSFTEVTGTGQSSIAYGQGWWLISRDAKTITIEGTPLSIDFEKTLSSGYQVVACPYYDQSVSWSDVTSDASNASLGLGENLYDWDGSGDYAKASKMEAGKAYWVWADNGGTITIKRSYTSKSTSQSTQRTSSNQPPPPLGPGAYVQAYAPQGECSKGKSTWIQWQAQGIAPQGHKRTVSISCSTDGGKTYSLIEKDVENSGYYLWTPAGKAEKCIIKISSSVYPDVSSTTESFSVK